MRAILVMVHTWSISGTQDLMCTSTYSSYRWYYCQWIGTSDGGNRWLQQWADWEVSRRSVPVACHTRRKIAKYFLWTLCKWTSHKRRTSPVGLAITVLRCKECFWSWLLEQLQVLPLTSLFDMPVGTTDDHVTPNNTNTARAKHGRDHEHEQSSEAFVSDFDATSKSSV